MFFRLLLLFTLVPLVELWLLIEIGRLTGVLPTVALVFATGALGAWLARSQGLATLAKVRRETAEGRMPATALVDGLLILIAGAVLLTPGLLTDVFGFFLLIPAGRSLIRKSVAERFKRSVESGRTVIVVDDYQVRTDPSGSDPFRGGQIPGDGP